ncbi:hypothetical protein F5Y11DRAFT_87450 [Daldinia sp. FL1419]|nr:hypothetical protein F5Y11DRAFT_87450 [Daldinia sp. FL1419]
MAQRSCDLSFCSQLVAAYGGFRGVGLTAGETVLIAPAIGNYGGEAAHVALAMGARVIAMGHNKYALSEPKALAPKRVNTVVVSEDVEIDLAAIAKYRPVNVFQNFAPPIATNKSHIQAAFLSIRPGGPINFMGCLKKGGIPK